MKKIIMILVAIVIVGTTCIPVCTHVHTEECGENGIDCIHECIDSEVNSPRDEDPPM